MRLNTGCKIECLYYISAKMKKGTPTFMHVNKNIYVGQRTQETGSST